MPVLIKSEWLYNITFLCFNMLVISCLNLSKDQRKEVIGDEEHLELSKNNESFSDEFLDSISINIDVTKYTKMFKANHLSFKVIWDQKLSFSDNIGHYGGIKELEIYKRGNNLNTLYNLEDAKALGLIQFQFDDFNFDGELDFRIPVNDKHWKYYLFNPTANIYGHAKDWDHVRLIKTDKKNKLITSRNWSNATQYEDKVYEVEGLKLKLIQ
ncbi:MAG: hypothetical protein HRU50_00045 [Winogradskyella sp.]|uniref:XAC2610-related protein n=1 Tax=Winogradskyella sp. TaxID=1883156 RepID=UPI0025DD8F2B|nr:hypothetical protein [Winogradskyella sp.]NRB58311.1 hypothetical protein [Winogradskyella sp.]